MSLAIAFAHAKNSTEHTKVGCCIRDDRDVIAGVGHNNVPIDAACGRDQRRPYAIHAETLAVIQMLITIALDDPYGAPTLMQRETFTAYVTHHPCVSCMALLAFYDVRRIVYALMPDPDIYDHADLAHAAHTLGLTLTRVDYTHTEDT